MEDLSNPGISFDTQLKTALLFVHLYKHCITHNKLIDTRFRYFIALGRTKIPVYSPGKC